MYSLINIFECFPYAVSWEYHIPWLSCVVCDLHVAVQLRDKVLHLSNSFFFFFGSTLWLSGSCFLSEGLNPSPLQWKHGVHWTTKEVPKASKVFISCLLKVIA